MKTIVAKMYKSDIKKLNKKAKQKLLAGIALFAVVILIASGVLVYYEYFTEEGKIQEKKEETTIIDDRVSPLENQGLVLEVLRIRHRGLLDKLMKIGNSWKNKPSFFFITNMDGLEYVSKNVEYHGRIVKVVFNAWDTIFQENKIMKEVDEENATSKITLTIVEEVKSGILRRMKEIPRDTMTVTYDFRTGRWSGDDNFGDYDGYGYYLGETFEIWFNLYQIDYDNDFIPYWTEVNILGTDPTVDDSKLDPDGDGVPTSWEWKWGYDPFTWDDHKRLDPDLDGIENIEEYQMTKYLANPFIQDIYYEVDLMGRGGLFDPVHKFYEESQQAIIERLAQHNIRIFFDDGWPNTPINGGGQILPHIDMISQDSGMILQFYNNYFPEERRGIFRYMVVGHDAGFQHPSKNNIYDTTQAYNKYQMFKPIKNLLNLVSSGVIPTPRGVRLSTAGLVLHEIAHSCSVDADNCAFGGIDNVSYGTYIIPNKKYKETWANYRSVLNYLYTSSPKVIDLSDGKNGEPYDQNDWGLMFVGFFQCNANLIEEPFYAMNGPTGGETLVDIEWRITDYTYDANLTKQFVKYIGDYSPIDPIKVNWSVYKVIDKEKYPNYPEIKVYAQPKIKTTQQKVLYQEGDLDSRGNVQFYSFDEILKEKTR